MWVHINSNPRCYDLIVGSTVHFVNGTEWGEFITSLGMHQCSYKLIRTTVEYVHECGSPHSVNFILNSGTFTDGRPRVFHPSHFKEVDCVTCKYRRGNGN